MIEIATMAASLVGSFLVPLLKQGAEGLATQLQERTSQSVADKLVTTAQRLWERVKGSPKSGDDQDIVTVFERQPEVMREALERIVRRQLEQDDKFRKDVNGLLEADAEPGVAAWKLMGEIVGAVDARHATISGGTVAGVVYHAGPAQPEAPPDSSASASPTSGTDDQA